MLLSTRFINKSKLLRPFPKSFIGNKFCSNPSNPPQTLYFNDKSSSFRTKSMLSLLAAPAFISLIDIAYMTDYSSNTKLAMSGLSLVMGAAFYTGVNAYRNKFVARITLPNKSEIDIHTYSFFGKEIPRRVKISTITQFGEQKDAIIFKVENDGLFYVMDKTGEVADYDQLMSILSQPKK